MAQCPLTLSGLKSEDIEGTDKLRVTAQLRGFRPQDETLEQIVVRLSLEPGVSSVSWSLTTQRWSNVGKIRRSLGESAAVCCTAATNPSE
jgi:hypothetical protein